MGRRQRRQQLEFDAFVDRGFPFSSSTTDDDDLDGYPGTQTQNNAISTSIGLDSATTETINTNGDTLSLVVVSTVYGNDPSVTSYTATSSSLPATTSSQRSSPTLTPAPTSSTNPASAGETTSSPTPMPVEHHKDNDLSSGELAAAIVVPIVVVLALAALLFLCFRRRKQQSRGEREGSIGAAFIPASIKEKWTSMRTSNASAPRDQPIVTNPQNNAYNTGLDTSSQGSDQHSGEYTPGRTSEGGTTFVQPPPPYTLPQMRQNTPLNMSLDIPRSPQEPPPARSPLSNTINTPSAAALLAMPLDPPRPSSRSARSITSTLYSDTASVHSARAARVSVAGPNVVRQSQTNVSRSNTSGSGGGDPFDTEANTPVTPLSSR
ncbi:hypothetical protein M409DRAFT_60357 [Zasmidium cellare ATCC 36951]|uniref:Uncharacterized protein n=1 Tax=Zasmidium cellare ATCC 36951 TaxID=1080233 RepID=A0A6A6C3H6_ZASCE|nr:uncharacterized protein M409DRAFT_60357 [Zasmidium cellare ATCC 36951]KAF2159946.1 hypothetical protein M409DRAFT_60357 [Zasmidium cellare ATCC 36951]